jgi:hypothetical protein
MPGKHKREEEMMRQKLLILAIFAASALAHGAEKGSYAVPIEQEALVYERHSPDLIDQPLFRVSNNDRLLVLDTRGEKLRIRDGKNREGWIEARLVRQVGRSALMEFDDADVYGYIENPAPIVILESDQRGESFILPDRSFHEELKQNIDRETAERRNHTP